MLNEQDTAVADLDFNGQRAGEMFPSVAINSYCPARKRPETVYRRVGIAGLCPPVVSGRLKCQISVWLRYLRKRSAQLGKTDTTGTGCDQKNYRR